MKQKKPAPGQSKSNRGAPARAATSAAAPGDVDADGLRPVHLLVLGVMGSATAAALLVHGTRLSNIIFIMLAVVAAGFVAVEVYRTLVPLTVDAPIAEPEMIGGRTRAALEREKAIVLRAIKELEFDRAMGKVSESDCAEMVGKLRARAVRLIRQLDAGSAGYHDLIQRELDARLGTKAGTPAPSAARGTAEVGANAGGAVE